MRHIYELVTLVSSASHLLMNDTYSWLLRNQHNLTPRLETTVDNTSMSSTTDDQATMEQEHSGVDGKIPEYHQPKTS